MGHIQVFALFVVQLGGEASDPAQRLPVLQIQIPAGHVSQR
jgi:hypothetical protein